MARAGTNSLVVQSQPFTNQFSAYAQVEPVAVIPVQPLETGVVTGLDVLPGATVHAGQKLGGLTGPEIDAAQRQAEAKVAGAKAKLVAAKKTLQVAREQLASHLSTQQEIAEAESAVANAGSQLTVARVRLQMVQTAAALSAPSDGTVLSVAAANGQRVTPGQTILTLQPAGGLWLRATYYGGDTTAMHPGMVGQFVPTSGKPVPVKVATVFGALGPDGGKSVGLFATVPNPGWLNGQFGTVTLNGEVRSLAVVPTQALILDKGKWWVLVRTTQGSEPHQVVPGPARGWRTFIESGLKPGERVVVENAYLEFHRNTSKSYKPPD